VIVSFPYISESGLHKRVVGLDRATRSIPHRRADDSTANRFRAGGGPYFEPAVSEPICQFIETLGNARRTRRFRGVKGLRLSCPAKYKPGDACVTVRAGVACTVPPESYFVMGDIG